MELSILGNGRSRVKDGSSLSCRIGAGRRTSALSVPRPEPDSRLTAPFRPFLKCAEDYRFPPTLTKKAFAFAVVSNLSAVISVQKTVNLDWTASPKQALLLPGT